MKNITFFIMLCLSIALVKAQYPYTLPLTHVNFFAASAMGVSPNLEFGIYTAATDPININKWNLTRASAKGGFSPVVENNTLSSSNYIDNNNGKAIVLNDTNAHRGTVFSLTNDFEFRSKYVYVSVLVNFSKAPAAETSFFHWDGDYTANNARGVAFVMADGDGFKIGCGASTAATIKGWSQKLNFNQTYFLVMKAYAAHTVAGGDTGIDIYALYINPIVGSTEEQSAANLIASISNNGTAGYVVEGVTVSRMANGVRGIVVRQNIDIGAKLAGLRFSDKWEDVVAGSPNALTKNKLSNAQVFVNADKQLVIQSAEPVNYVVYSTSGSEIAKGISSESKPLQLKKGVYIVKTGTESFKIVL